MYDVSSVVVSMLYMYIPQFYGVMTAVYTIYAFAWIVMMACSYKDLVRLQFWVLAVILLGFLEKMLFVSEYGSVNTGHDRKRIFSLSLPPLTCICGVL